MNTLRAKASVLDDPVKTVQHALRQIKDIPVALYALGTCPRKSIPVTQGKRDIPLSFGGAEFRPGDYVYTDTDGVIVTAEAL